MKIVKIMLLLIMSPFLISSYGLEYASFGKTVYPTISSYWEVDPVIKVCKGLNISRHRVNMALEYWRKLGYTFEKIVFDDESISCAGKPMFGEIIISIPDQDFDYSKIALTKRTFRKDIGIVIYAEISLQENKVTKERVLEHEIGHALGWDHTNIKYHIMHESWEYGGHSSSGLSHRRYKELYELIKLSTQ